MAAHNEIFERMVEAAAEAMEKDSLARGRQYAESYSIDLERVRSVLDFCRSGTDREVAIVLFAMIDDILKYLFEKRMTPGFKLKPVHFLQHQGILSTTSSRLQLAGAFGWISEGCFRDLDTIRRIRNEFAHQVGVDSFADRKIAGMISGLRDTDRLAFDAAVAASVAYSEHQYSPTLRSRFIGKSVLVVHELVLWWVAIDSGYRFAHNPHRLVSLLVSDQKGQFHEFTQVVFRFFLEEALGERNT